MKLTKRKRTILTFISFGVFFLLVFGVTLYSLGYRLDHNWRIQKTGGIFIQSNESGAAVAINGTVRKTTSLFSEQAFIRNLTPNVFSVEVSKESFHSWRKSLLVQPETVDARDALLVPLNPIVTIIGTSSPIYERSRYTLKNHVLSEYVDPLTATPVAVSVKRFWELPRHGGVLIQGEDEQWYLNKDKQDVVSIFENASEEADVVPILTSLLTSKEHIIFDDGENQVIYWDDHTIGSYWIGKRKDLPQWQKGRGVHILTMPGKIRNVAIFPKHPDYLLMELGSSIWAVEMDQVGGQNLMPVYQGTAPRILGRTTNGITISDNKKIMEVELP